MSHRPSLSALDSLGAQTASTGRTGLLLALLALLLAGAVGWVLPARTLLPLENALRADAEQGISSEPRP
jgi:hypothetical protein